MDVAPASGSSIRVGKNRNWHNKKSLPVQRFANYLVFGFTSTVCLALFCCCYLLVLIILWPLLREPTPESIPDESAREYIQHIHVPPSLEKIAHVTAKERLGEVTSNLRKKLVKFRQGNGFSNANLLDHALADYEAIQKERKKISAKSKADALDWKNSRSDAVGAGRKGFMILGMHRSGTSMLGGLLHNSAGYVIGGPLIGSSFDNEMGFFERIDIVLQNDEFMHKQGVDWASNVINYDWEQGLKDKESGVVTFKEGSRGLLFLNNPNNAPWIQKDPRMCITLKTWLKLMNNEPAIVFTYRHPLEVALSINKRDNSIAVETGLRLWIVYNMRAVQNSKGLCIVRSCNDAILANPLNEVQRIIDELTTKCHVPAPPNRMTQETIEKFLDPKLQHNKKKASVGKEVIHTYNDGNCEVHSYISHEEEGTAAYKREHNLYQKAMKIYCDFQSGVAYADDYEWPELN